MEKYDLVVIGAGPGGYPAAIRAAQLGARVALVEREELGGTCLNWGCIPTKTLIASADLYRRIRTAEEMGLAVSDVSADYGRMAARKGAVVEKLRGGVASLLKANGVEIVKGTASFESRTLLSVEIANGAVKFGADKFIVATGSAPIVPHGVPDHLRVHTSRSFLNLTKLPESVIVLGGWVIGCEFACLLASLGVKVTVVELLEDILLALDRDVRREVRRHMEKVLGVRVLTGAALEDIKADGKGVRGRAGDEAVEAAILLVACGRRPVPDGLALERAGIEPDERGAIPVDANGRTKAANVFAVGDVTGGAQLAHAATSQGLVAAENALGKRLRENETVVPSCIFTMPEVGAAGLTETEAKERGVEVKRAKFNFAAVGRALASNEAAGFVKLLACAKTGQILGAQAVGPHATELIAEAALAIHAELTAEELARTMHAHPTLSEIWMECAHVLAGQPVHSVPPRRR